MFSADAVEKSLFMTQAALHYKAQYLDAAMGQLKRLEDGKRKVEQQVGEQAAAMEREGQQSAALKTEVRHLQHRLEQVEYTHTIPWMLPASVQQVHPHAHARRRGTPGTTLRGSSQRLSRLGRSCGCASYSTWARQSEEDLHWRGSMSICEECPITCRGLLLPVSTVMACA